MDGVIVVDKPEGLTSHDVVSRIRRLAGTRRVGHLGTLDPMATGVLPLVVGRATRLAQFYQKSEKIYEAVIHFGFSTDSYDRDGTATSEPVEVSVTAAQLLPLMERFRGRIQQTPPPISAKKIAGVPAYKLARRQQPVELEPVEVEIYSFELLGCEGPDARVRVHCSAGTYLRTIAHDLGRMLGSGAHLSGLRRTASGAFDLKMARTLEELQAMASEGRLADAVVGAAELLPEFPSETVDAATAAFIRQGRDFRVSPFRSRGGARYVKAITRDGELIAIGEAMLPNVYHPILVL